MENKLIEILQDKPVILLKHKENTSSFFLIYHDQEWLGMKMELEEAMAESPGEPIELDVLSFEEVDAFLEMKAPETMGIFLSEDWEPILDPHRRFDDYLDDLEIIEKMELSDLYDAIGENALETAEELLENLSEIMLLINNYNYRLKQLNQLEKIDLSRPMSSKALYQMIKEEQLQGAVTEPVVARMLDLSDVTFKMLAAEENSTLAVDHLSNLLKLHFMLKGVLEGEVEDVENPVE